MVISGQVSAPADIALAISTPSRRPMSLEFHVGGVERAMGERCLMVAMEGNSDAFCATASGISKRVDEFQRWTSIGQNGESEKNDSNGKKKGDYRE